MIREIGDDEAFDLMVIENLQRKDLTPCETAEAFRAYLDRHAIWSNTHMIFPSALAWTAANQPRHKYPEEMVPPGPCATCGVLLVIGVPLSAVETPTMANHADYFRFGSRHICPACAWLFDAGKGRPGNFVVFGDRIEYTVISLDSPVTDKRPWLHVLRDLAGLPPATPVSGVMTTDVKPRLWPRARLATVARFGLYLHAPEYDVSEWREFDLAEALQIIGVLLPVLAAGFAKASLYHGLFRDFKRASGRPRDALAWEDAVSRHRLSPAFLPALIAAGIHKGEPPCRK